jgi:hypothetical protein
MMGRVVFLLVTLLLGIVIPLGGDSGFDCPVTYTAGEDNTDLECPMPSANNVTFYITITDGPIGSSITAGAMIYAIPRCASSDPRISFGIALLRAEITNAPIAKEIEGLGFDMLRDYAIAYRGSIPVFNEWQNGTPGWTSWRPYAVWTENGGMGWGSVILPEDWENLSLVGDVVEIENLTVYLKDGQAIRCGPDIIRIAANFTRVSDTWDSTYHVEIEGGEAQVDGLQIDIDLGGAIPVDPIRCLPYIGIAAGVITVLVMVWHRKKQQ